MFYQLPPVGNPIYLSSPSQLDTLPKIFGANYQPHYFSSGTAALAAAIMAAIRLKKVDEPEVLLPAYGCPDLVSAAVFAGAKPVLVDFEADRPWMDFEELSAKISMRAVAIVAVDLFGIPERMQRLRQLAEQAGVLLIEDSAQAFPSGKEQDIWQGDLVVLSFGRGKPVSLLGGGAVLSRARESRNNMSINIILGELLSENNLKLEQSICKKKIFSLKVWLYNRIISPRLYWLPQALPFLHLGETRYHPLCAIESMNSEHKALLPVNITAYRDDEMLIQKELVDMLEKLSFDGKDFTDLPKACKIAEDRRLLRYPLLVKPEDREKLYTELRRFGLGPSRMYPTALSKIPGLESLLSDQGDFPVASSFAERLLTLPTHKQVCRKDIAKMNQVLCSL